MPPVRYFSMAYREAPRQILFDGLLLERALGLHDVAPTRVAARIVRSKQPLAGVRLRGLRRKPQRAQGPTGAGTPACQGQLAARQRGRQAGQCNRDTRRQATAHHHQHTQQSGHVRVHCPKLIYRAVGSYKHSVSYCCRCLM